MSDDTTTAFFANLVYDTGFDKSIQMGMVVESPDGNLWTVLKTSDVNLQGFQAAAYQNIETGQIIVATRGTEPTSKMDLYADLQMGMDGVLAGLPNQFVLASNFLSSVEAIAGANPISLTGHSLGGSLAEWLGAESHYPTVTYNAYGIGTILAANLMLPDDSDFSNIVNNVIDKDPVMMSCMGLPQATLTSSI
ncbi:uncharacterized protein NMK_2419 [Novimethylophilus kurashikiensis]|uniref:Fungal lipase-like domain-containing protein n=1 Tax=Novimethylophilus kurashikiensis TaxID=1825523 RepID=A0A2R5FB95_9PROT|nr:hypothetical protein [Novimethylophilus kurashikiensis]GBG14818.1 uncharacterized protein NMK_2419 [Novimethylophilus kurashikiensis]